MNTTRILLIVVLAWGLAAELANADFAFGTPTNLGPMAKVNNSGHGNGPSISADGLSLVFQSNRPGGSGGSDLWVTTRATTVDDWGSPVNLGPTVNSSGGEFGPNVSADGLSLYFSTFGTGGSRQNGLWLSSRLTTDDPWGTPVNLGPSLNGPAFHPSISADGLSLFFNSSRPGGSGGTDLWVATRATTGDPWSSPVNLGPTVNSSTNEMGASISADGLTLFFDSQRSGDRDLWVTTRATKEDDWAAPVNLGPAINTSAQDIYPGISADGSTLYFSSTRPGVIVASYNIYQVSISPVVDFNGDGKVDIKDLVRLIESWGQDDPSSDIAPGPFGDAVVDVKDLEVLMSYWGQEADDPTLMAYWKLDETEGDIVYDSGGKNDAVSVGEPVWQPDAGRLGGALQFDGLDDAVIADPVLNPTEGPFSVFAWIKGGGPGQVILSQSEGANWLMLDPQGYLKTTLKSSRRDSDLTSEGVIANDTWHRVGFTWDGMYRILYVDNIEVARDTKIVLQGSQGDLLIGVGSDLDPSSSWSGLIDDVRIYDRVVEP